MLLNSKILGHGHFLPKKILTNDDFLNFIDTSDEWIFSRTGIKQRHVAAKNELTSNLAINAAKSALDSAKLKPSQIDCIILATTTPDDTFPSTATKVQNKLNMNHIAAFDIQAVCSGFVYSLHIADCLIKCRKAKNVMVIGAETLSKIVDWKDRRTCVLFGDGAGAVILGPSEKNDGILATKLYSDGSWHDSLFSDGGPSSNQRGGNIRMNGQDIFKQAVNKLTEATLAALKDCKLSMKSLNTAISFFAPNVTILIIICTYWSLGNKLTIALVFSTLALIHVLRLTIGKNLCFFLEQVGEAITSVQRIEHFLLMDEYIDINDHSKKGKVEKDQKETLVEETTLTLTNASFKWNKTDDKNALEDISFKLCENDLCVIDGATGSGKSALLQAIL